MTMGDEDLTTVRPPAPPNNESFRSASCFISILRGAGAGETIRINDAASRRLLIGQGAGCDVQLGDRAVSRQHAAIDVIRGTMRLTDLGSSNGTWVNGLQIGAVHLRGDEIIGMGNTVLRASLDAPCTEAPCTEAPREGRFGSLLGRSLAMRELFPVFEKLARSDVPVLIEGETGTGKEVLAEAIHEASGRTGPFVVFDCTAVAPSLFEAELFGHERGAFTGADRARTGIFEEAHGGTLFIDEIGDLAIASQAKLLRALERRQVRRVGGNGHVHVDVRVIAATRRDLELEVQERRFRDDLFFRLAVARVELPPLRKRQGDIELLTRSFWSSMGGKDAFPIALLQRFENYDWPGNVRELRNVMARYLALGSVALPDRGGEGEHGSNGAKETDWIDDLVARALPLRKARAIITSELERRYVKHMLELHAGDMARAAEASGVGRRYFQMLRTKI